MRNNAFSHGKGIPRNEVSPFSFPTQPACLKIFLSQPGPSHPLWATEPLSRMPMGLLGEFSFFLECHAITALLNNSLHTHTHSHAWVFTGRLFCLFGCRLACHWIFFMPHALRCLNCRQEGGCHWVACQLPPLGHWIGRATGRDRSHIE